MGKYNIGDKVRIIDKWDGNHGQNVHGKMDKWLGKVMTIREVEISCYGDDDVYYMDEDRGEVCGRGWPWYERFIAEKVGEESPYPTCKACKYVCSCCASRGDASKCYNCVNDNSDFKPAENIKHCPITGLKIMQNQYKRCKHMKDTGICSKLVSNSGYCEYPCSYYERIDDV